MMSIILPTAGFTKALRGRLSQMTNANYDLLELVSLAVTAIEHRDTVTFRIQEIKQQLLNRGLAVSDEAFSQMAQQAYNANEPFNFLSVTDAERLSEAWGYFAVSLANMFMTNDLWDADGSAKCYFNRFVGDDIVCSYYPT